jgi:hypothetical protein
VSLAVAGIAVSTNARAIDMAPGDYTVLPAGTNLALFYLQYMHYDNFNIDGVGDIPESELGVAIGIARYVHYFDFGGLPVSVQGYLPFGGFTDAEIGGFTQSTEEGLGDLVLGATVYPVNTGDPLYGTVIGFTQFVTLPTGAYDAAAISVGTGTTTFTSQIGVIQGLGSGFFVDASLDVAFALDHDEFNGEHSKDPSVHAQAYLRYQFSPATSVALGYSGHFGGMDYVEDVYTGTQTESHQLRAFASTFLTETIQVQGMVGTDFAAEGGFESDISTELRILAAF